MERLWFWLSGLLTGVGIVLLALPAPAHADPPACVVGKDTVWNNPVCRDCWAAHPFDMRPCTESTPPGVKP